jgi:hypothetical protein
MLRRLATGLAFLALAAPAPAAVVYVGNDGLDGAACGTQAAPCRSISQGIARAAAGDTVVVGPGRYGDLDGDETFGEPGEEFDSMGGIVHVDKAVRVISRDGAAATFIEGTQPSAIDTHYPVLLEAAGATLGARDHGFTITSPPNRQNVFGLTPGVRVEGNVAIGGRVAFDVSGAGSSIADSRAFRSEIGFENSLGDVRVDRSAAVATTHTGFRLEGADELTRSVAVATGRGVDADLSSASLVLVSAVGNTNGVHVGNAGGRLDRISVYGNALCGIDAGVDFGRVFFGAATGPGDDPADAICGGATAKVAKREFRVRLRPLR